jgi:NADH-quinone oxidoreductase subunit N
MTDLWISLRLAHPEVILMIGSLVLLVFGVFRGDKSTRSVTYAVVGLCAFAALAVVAGPVERSTAFNELYVTDAFAGFLKVVILIGAAACALMAVPYFEERRMARFEYPIVVLLAALGMCMMVSANDLISLYVGLELQSLSLYVMASFQRDSAKSSEAGLKYFVLGALSSGLLLYGCSLVYGFAGTTNFSGLQQVLSGGEMSLGLLFGLVFVIAGMAFKVSAVPFHMWTPDVYEGAPTPVTALFAAAPKVAAMGLFARVLFDAFGTLEAQWQQIIIFLSIASMLLGAVAAIAQTNIKRLLAYSSIANMGYALIGLAAGSEAGVRGLLVYMALYMAMTVGSFLVVLAMRRDGRQLEQLDDLAGLAQTKPAMAAALAILMFSLAGIPLLAGFFGKLYIFVAAMEAKLYTLAIIGVLASVVGAYYYLRIVKVMYFDAPAPAFSGPPSRTNGALLALSAAACSPLSFFYIAPLLQAATVAAKSLLG